MPQQQIFRRGLTAIFLAVVATPFCLKLIGFDVSVSLDEKRKLRSAPRMNGGLRGPLLYAMEYRDYFNDTFPLRKLLVNWNSSWRADVFHANSVGPVLVGAEGWLYLRTNPADNTPCTMPVAPYTPAELSYWRDNLRRHAERLGEQGVEFHFMVAPNKASIHPEHLPIRLPQRTRADQFFDSHENEFPALDVRAGLIALKDEFQVYEKRDTHWSPRGAWEATRMLIRHLSAKHRGLTTASLDEYVAVRQTHESVGDLVRMAGLANRAPENVPSVERPGGPVWREMEFPSERMPKGVKQRSKLRATVNPGAHPATVVVFHDSFFARMVPYFSEVFEKVYYVTSPWIDHDFVKEVGGQMVILELVERKLNVGTPDYLKVR